MALALARKYRPKSFDDLVGQDTVSLTLAQALDGNRLSHAYLFSGLRGSGKTSTARIFAKALLCDNGPTSKPCEECINCKMANENRHMDIIEMDAASNRGIDDIKDLIEHTKYKPSSGRYKIFIIDEVHMLTTQAFNALLKTLEEPPDFVKFVLATTDPLKVPATILSRTQHFRFKKIPQRIVSKHLEHILNLENIEYESEAIDIIARAGAGSLRDSLTLLDQAIVYAKDKIDLITVTTMLGIIDPGQLDNLLDAISDKNRQEILNFVSSSAEYEAEMIIDELTMRLKSMLLEGDNRFTPLIMDRFFRVLADAKSLLQIGSESEFVLTLTLLKMTEALSIRDIDETIDMLKKELESNKGVTVLSPQPKIKTPQKQKPSNTTQVQKEEKTPQTSNTQLKFNTLIEKLYDREYELGDIFKKNITFKSFENSELIWISKAQGEDRNFLINRWSIIRMFVQEIFGLDTKIKTEKESNNTQEDKKKSINQTANKQIKNSSECNLPQNAVTSSTIEAQELPSSCMNPDTGSSEASKEKDPSTLLQEPMVKEAIELFGANKVRIRPKS